MTFVNRIKECRALCEQKESPNFVKTLVVGDNGIGKSALIQKAFSKKRVFFVDTTREYYFEALLLEAIHLGLHNYLIDNSIYNYKDLFFGSFANRNLQPESILRFLLNNTIYKMTKELCLEEILVDFLMSLRVESIILDNFQCCSTNDYGRILKLLNIFYQRDPSYNISFVFSLSERDGFPCDNLVAICDKVIVLEGLEKKYIEIILKEFFKNENGKYDLLSEYFYEKHKGNPGIIKTILKLQFGNISECDYDQDEIFQRILSPRFFNLDPTEERIMLYLAVMPFASTKEQIKKFLRTDPNFLNIDNINTCMKKLSYLTDQNLVISKDNTYEVSNVIRGLYQNYSKDKEYLVYLIYNYQKKCRKSLVDREISDCLYFIIQSKTITVTDEMLRSFFSHTAKTASFFVKNEMWKESVAYFLRIVSYKDLFDEHTLIDMLKSFYYNANYLELRKFISTFNDNNFTTFDYWFWKGNILYMLNDAQSIVCLDNAIIFASSENQKIFAQIVRNESMSELPEYCHETLSHYNTLLENYEKDDYPALANLYRNSLVLGGKKTIELCNKGILIAKKYNNNEELIKLNHNKYFEMFRMSDYAGCDVAFENTVNYFQNNPKRLYETAYGYNNLALVNLIENNLENARLYAASAMIYAGTPYSQITTHVNYNLIESFCDHNEEKLNKRVERIEELIQKYDVEDYRIFRKSYFSIAISYLNIEKNRKAIEYVRKSEQYLLAGKHINRYFNLCQRLKIEPVCFPDEIVEKEDKYYNFYSNPKYELWLLAFGHL